MLGYLVFSLLKNKNGAISFRVCLVFNHFLHETGPKHPGIPALVFARCGWVLSRILRIFAVRSSAVTPSAGAQFSDRWLPPCPFAPTPTIHTHPPATMRWGPREFAARAPTPGARPGAIGPRFRHRLRNRFSVRSPVGISPTHFAPSRTLRVHRAGVGISLGGR